MKVPTALGLWLRALDPLSVCHVGEQAIAEHHGALGDAADLAQLPRATVDRAGECAFVRNVARFGPRPGPDAARAS